MVRQAGAVLGLLFLAHAAAAQFVQQGSKLVGTGAVGAAWQANSVAISADGNTALVGGPDDNPIGTLGQATGATWMYTRTAGVWSQQDSKLVGTGAVGAASQGWSVAISADGNTAIIGGPTDNSGVGTAWMFARNGEAWSQQGSKLVATDATGLASQGFSVAISADGNTAIVGGPYDNSWAGAAWVYTRSGGVWSQQGGKLVGNDAAGPAAQGASVAISADGNTAIVGGKNDNWPSSAEYRAGAAWVYTRSGGVWSQEGNKLVGTGAVASAGQGRSVAISGDGNTVIVGADLDDSVAGAVWVYTRSGGVWSQQGGKLVGSGAAGNAGQGTAVAISGGGNIAIVGGPYDNSNAGAAWVFTLNGGVWSQTGSKLVGTDSAGPFVYQGWSVAISGDGTTSIIGGPADNTLAPFGAGAAWVFVSNGCAAPSNTTQPQGRTIQSGQTVMLSVTATGTPPLSWLWYQGTVADTSTPVGTDASTFTTPPLESTTSYWVRVTNACGTADSATATITVEPRVRRHLQRAK